MRLRLNLCDVDVQLKISGWSKSNTLNEWDDNWCNVELSIMGQYINYEPHGEILMSAEVVHLSHMLSDLLGGELKENAKVEFVEPDLQFDLRVRKRLYSIPEQITYKNGFIDIDIEVDMVINFWYSGRLGTNRFIMNMNREEIEALNIYLKYVMGEIDIEDERIVSFIDEGMLLPE